MSFSKSNLTSGITSVNNCPSCDLYFCFKLEKKDVVMNTSLDGRGFIFGNFSFIFIKFYYFF